MGWEGPQDWQAGAASALEWWREAGVDALIAEEPRDWLARPVPANVAAAIAETAVVEKPPLPATLAEFDAWRVSDAAPDSGWSDKRIGAAGDPASGLMILIEMPEREDVEAGILLSGAPGRLFDRMLAAIGRDRGSVYLAALCVARPVSGRVAPEMTDALAEIARHHVSLVAPRRLLVIGNAPSRALVGTDAVKARGGLHVINLTGPEASPGGEHATQAVASFHPRFLLETPAAKAEAWKDLQMLIGGMES